MKSAVIKFLAVFLFFVAFFVMQKLAFLSVYGGMGQSLSVSDVIDVISHGFTMDCSMAAYLTAIPAILIIVGIWVKSKWLDIVGNVYFAIVSAILAIVTVVDIALYGYWGFRLDTTPIFYFTSSPSAAMASTAWWQPIVALIATILIAIGLYLLYKFTIGRIKIQAKARTGATVVMTLLTALLFIPMRGSLTVSTMNLSHAFYSQNQHLNQAAVNPLFSLMSSATHQTDFASQYRFMPDGEAAMLIAALDSACTDSSLVAPRPELKARPANVYLIILESFSAQLMPSLGGEPIAIGLDSIATEGIAFTNFMASSFRTDRALPAILSAFPGQPSTSLMKFVDKAGRLPSIAREMAKAGYEPSYYYGGDINFTNMKAYLVNSGFANIISDKDFAISEKSSKWGAPDHILFQRALADAKSRKEGNFTVIQTSSSHEPFEVPYPNPRFADNKRKNCFAYADSCVAAFVDSLAALPSWDNTLVFITADHYGVWPEKLDDPVARHHVPFIITGGALAEKGRSIATPASQTDIAATMLGMLDLDNAVFAFSHDIFDPTAPHFGAFSERSLMGIVAPNDTAVVDAESGRDIVAPACPTLSRQTCAYLQKIFDSLANL